MNDLKWVFKSGWNVFDFLYNDFKKILTRKFEFFWGGFPHVGPSKFGVSKNDHPSTANDLPFLL